MNQHQSNESYRKFTQVLYKSFYKKKIAICLFFLKSFSGGHVLSENIFLYIFLIGLLIVRKSFSHALYFVLERRKGGITRLPLNLSKH